MEKFNPKNYKSYEELPEDKKGEFAPVDGGFVRKEASDKFERAKYDIKQDAEKNNIDLSDKQINEIAIDSLRHYSFPAFLFEETELKSLFNFKISTKEDVIALAENWRNMDKNNFNKIFESSIEKMKSNMSNPSEDTVKELRQGTKMALFGVADFLEKCGFRYTVVNYVRPVAESFN